MVVVVLVVVVVLLVVLVVVLVVVMVVLVVVMVTVMVVLVVLVVVLAQCGLGEDGGCCISETCCEILRPTGPTSLRRKGPTCFQ